jgi:thiosulfate/3-mercaptopyruvate sulfurtransferase
MREMAMGSVCVLAILALVAIGPEGVAASADYARPDLLVSTHELANVLGDPTVKVLDARGPEDYAAGRIPGGISLPVEQTRYVERGIPGILAPIEDLEQLIGGLGIRPTDTMVVYGEVVGVRAARLFWTLEVLGHTKLRVLNGGMSKWAKEGRPISRGAPLLLPGRYAARADWTKYADAAYVLARNGSPDVVLLDCRSRREWTGEVASKHVRRGGRIPGARNVDWELNLTSEGGAQVLRSAQELTRLYADAGVGRDKEIVTYCRTGRRAAHTYLVLRLLGYPRIRVYDASMIEWGNRPELPIEK